MGKHSCQFELSFFYILFLAFKPCKRAFKNIVKGFDISTKYVVFYLHYLFGHEDIGTTPLLSIQKTGLRIFYKKSPDINFWGGPSWERMKESFVHMARYEFEEVCVFKNCQT
jgi:hypothetical protein